MSRIPVSLRRAATVAPLLALIVLGCSEVTAPAPASRHPLYVYRATHLPELTVFVGRSGQRITIDSAGRVDNVTVSGDGHLTVSTALFNPTRHAIVETTPEGRWLRTLLLLDPPPLATTARGMAYSPDGQRLAWYVTYGGVDSLFVLDRNAATPRGLGQFPRGFGPRAARWTPAGRIAFMADKALVTIDPATGARATVYTAADSLLDFDFAADGRLVVATDTRTLAGSALFVQREAGGPMLPLGATTESHGGVARWSPDGNLVATVTVQKAMVDGVASWQSVPDVIDLAGRHRRVRTAGARFSGIAGWTPDGRLLFLAYPPTTAEMLDRLDVYIAIPGGETGNLTRTAADYEDFVAIPR
jgi:dipeptidyl aminopeptidase/acylaminoacyl peptidase